MKVSAVSSVTPALGSSGPRRSETRGHRPLAPTPRTTVSGLGCTVTVPAGDYSETGSEQASPGRLSDGASCCSPRILTADPPACPSPSRAWPHCGRSEGGRPERSEGAVGLWGCGSSAGWLGRGPHAAGSAGRGQGESGCWPQEHGRRDPGRCRAGTWRGGLASTCVQAVRDFSKTDL